MNDEFLEISALGRTAYLGQLYNANLSKLLPSFSLYKSGAVKVRKTSVESTTLKLEEVKCFSDRAKSLDISAELSISILCGLFKVRGGGSYVSKQQDTSESHTVAAIAKFRRGSESLDLVDLQGQVCLPDEMLARTRATHVVTSISYGANIVGTLTQKSSNKEDTTDVKGNFALGAFNGIGKALMSVKGKAELSHEDREKLRNYNLDVELVTDIKLGDERMPVEPVALLELVAKSPSLVGEGVPCEIQLTPLSMLFSNIPSFRELAEADLIDICAAYDTILKLENSRLWLRDAVDPHNEIFPTFAARIRTHTLNVKKLVQTARDNLREYLHRYRSAGDNPEVSNGLHSTEDFISQINTSFSTEVTSYENDREEWRRYQEQLAATERHGFPTVAVSAIAGKMNRVHTGMLAVILVPDQASWEALVNVYGDVGVEIRQWLQSIDKVGVEGGATADASVTQFVSIFIDPLRTKTLETFDDRAGTLKSALKTANETKHAVFLTYGRSCDHVCGFGWNTLNKEGWGVIINKAQSWRYVGEVHFGKPHGRGTMTYVNNTRYTGQFCFGSRDGLGKMLDAEGKEIPGQCGVFIKNVLDPNGVIAEVTVLDQTHIPVQYGAVALTKGASLRSHVDRIGTLMEWDDKQKRCNLVLNGGTAKVKVVGSMIDPSELPSVEISSWPLETSPKLTAYLR